MHLSHTRKMFEGNISHGLCNRNDGTLFSRSNVNSQVGCALQLRGRILGRNPNPLS